MKKPDACKRCPLYGNGKGFVADELCDDAEVLIVAQNPGREEETTGRPMVGDSGDTLNDTLLPKAGVERGVDLQIDTSRGFPTWRSTGGNVSVANVLRCRLGRSNDLPKGDTLAQAVETCRQYDVVQPSVKLIVACGDLAWQTLSDNAGPVTEWRGRLVSRDDAV